MGKRGPAAWSACLLLERSAACHLGACLPALAACRYYEMKEVYYCPTCAASPLPYPTLPAWWRVLPAAASAYHCSGGGPLCLLPAHCALLLPPPTCHLEDLTLTFLTCRAYLLLLSHFSILTLYCLHALTMLPTATFRREEDSHLFVCHSLHCSASEGREGCCTCCLSSSVCLTCYSSALREEDAFACRLLPLPLRSSPHTLYFYSLPLLYMSPNCPACLCSCLPRGTSGGSHLTHTSFLHT